MKAISASLLMATAMALALPVRAPAAVMNAVKGTISDQKTGQPIAGVRITLISTRVQTQRIELTSDASGQVFKNGIPTGNYEVHFDGEGYLPARSSIRLSIGDSLDISVRLEPLPDPSASGAGLLRALVALVKEGQYAAAIDKAGAAIEKEPGNAMLHYYRGYSREKTGAAAAAVVDYARAAELKPEFVLALTSLAKLQARQGEYAQAAANYQKALAQKGDDSDALYNYAICLVNMGDNAGAKAALEKTLALDPGHPDACYQLGIVLLGLGDMAGARNWLQKFLELDPEHKDAATAKQILDSLK